MMAAFFKAYNSALNFVCYSHAGDVTGLAEFRLFIKVNPIGRLSLVPFSEYPLVELPLIEFLQLDTRSEEHESLITTVRTFP